MAQVQFRLDIFTALANLIGAYEPVLLACVRDELCGLAAGRGKNGAAARAALALAERCTLITSGPPGATVDEKILYHASTHGCIVFTSDRHLRTALLAQGVPVISLLGKQRLELFRK
jgi:rRNA-processing protein FCF1